MHPLLCVAGSWSGPIVSSLSQSYMNHTGCEGLSTSTLIMPLFDMFKSRRARSSSLPRYPERYPHDAHVYNQASAYGPRSTSGSNRAAHPQRHGPSGYGGSSYPYPSSGAGRYSQSSTNDVRTKLFSMSPHPLALTNPLYQKMHVCVRHTSPGIGWNIRTTTALHMIATLSTILIPKTAIDAATCLAG